MTVVVVASKTTGTTTQAMTVGTEVTIYEVTAQSDDYIVTVNLDVSSLVAGDTLTLYEYIAVDATNYRLYDSRTISGPFTNCDIQFGNKIHYKNVKWKVTGKQLSGTARTLSYEYALQILGTA